MSTFGTGAVFFRSVIFFEAGQEICFDVFELEVGFVQFAVTVVAVPQQSVGKPTPLTDAFDH